MTEGMTYDGKADANQQGQSTVEYALVLMASLAVVVALAALWHAGRDGSLQQLVGESASHALSSERSIGLAQDLLLY